MISYEQVEPHLSPDGSFRDVYIKDTSEQDLVSLLEYVKALCQPIRFVVDSEEVPVPETYHEIRDLTKDHAVCLGAFVCGALVNNHFFIEEEIELDFRPEDFSSPERWDCLAEFLNGLATKLQKKAIVTHENSPDLVICEFEPRKAEPGEGGNSE